MPKETKIFDLNLFSGSSELIRQAFGGYFREIDGDVEFLSVDTAPVSLTGPIMRKLAEETITDSLVTNITGNILPSIRYPIRFRVQDNSEINSDQQWRTYVVGGTFGDTEYPGIYNESVYADHSNTSSLPYLPREIVNTQLQPDIQITTEYFNYYPTFQDDTNELANATQAPNYYLITSSTGADILSYFTDYNSSVSRIRYLELDTYLESTYVSQEKVIDDNFENIFVMSQDGTITARNDNRRVHSRGGLVGSSEFDQDLAKLYSLMPFGNKIYFDNSFISTENEFKDILNSNQYQVKFIKLLKEVFQGESRLQNSIVNIAINTEATDSDGIYSGMLEETQTVSTNVVDLLTMMVYAYRNPTSETNNITIIDSGSYHTDFTFDTSGIYRYENTEKTLSVMNDFVEKAKLIFSSAVTTENITNIESFINQANSNKYFETMAFRVQKIGGQPTGDSNTENEIQNIWFYNQGEAIEYFDSQVKYDTDYTYRVFKYDLVQGYKYQLSDALVTRQLSTTSSGDDTLYCLEFYNPLTGEAASRLFAASGAGSESINESIQSLLKTSGFTRRLFDLRKQVTTVQNAISYLEPKIQQIRDMIDRIRRLISLPDPVIIQGFVDENVIISSDYPLYFEEVMNREQENYAFVVRHPPPGQEDLGSLLTFGTDAAWIYTNEAPELRSNYQITTLRINLDTYEAWSSTLPQLREVNTLLIDFRNNYEDVLEARNQRLSELQEQIRELEEMADLLLSRNTFFSSAQLNSMFPYLMDFNITIEPSIKIVEIPLDEKRMRIVDHPPNDFVITPHHLLDQSNRLAFYCKYDTFSMNSVNYPPTLTEQDEQNRNAYLEGHDLLATSEQTQESVSLPRFLEVYRVTEKPTSYSDFANNLRTTIDLRQPNGDIPTDYLFVERVRENTKYYYAFRALNENRVAGQMSSVFESELINDGGYVYSNFEQYSEDDLAVPTPREPLISVKKLFNIIPNIQHLQLDTSTATFNSSSASQLSEIALGTDADDDLWDPNKYYKIRLTSRKTGKKIDINVGFKKEERN